MIYNYILKWERRTHSHNLWLLLVYRKWSIYNPADISDIVYVALFCVRFLTLAPGAKEYIITPIYKSGNKNDITNYNHNLGEFSEPIAERYTVRQVRDVSCHVLKIYTSINCCCYCCCSCCCYHRVSNIRNTSRLGVGMVGGLDVTRGNWLVLKPETVKRRNTETILKPGTQEYWNQEY